VLAEGVETREQLEILLREGCDEVQGFLLGHPEANVEAGFDPPREVAPDYYQPQAGSAA